MTVASMSVLVPLGMVALVPASTTGSEFTVTKEVMLHPLLLVYVITLVPAETAVTRPDIFTVATPGLADTQGETGSAVPDPVNWVVDPMHTSRVPVMVGKAFTVTAVASEEGP